MDEALQSQIDEANRLLGERKYDEIVPIVQPLVIRETGGQAQRVYGMALLGQGKYQESVHLLMTAAQKLPQDVTVAFAYGNAMKQNGQTEGARASFERALRIDANHPGAKIGFLNTSKALADRDEATEPMRAIEWLYGVWQRDPMNAEMAHRIVDIYIRNGWADQARQFADLLPPQLKNSEAMLAKIKGLPAAAPPISPANIRPAIPAAQGPVFESCPFCKQHIMMGIHTCPHCKMVIRAKNLPGADYKPEWQEVTLNIFCYLGVVFGALIVLLVFLTGTQSTAEGGFSLIVGLAIMGANGLIIARNDFWMNIARWLYVINTLRCVLCSMQAMTAVGSSTGQVKEFAMVNLVLTLIVGCYSGFMVYLLNHQGE